MGEGFTWDTQDRQRDIAAARTAWEAAKEMIADPAVRDFIAEANPAALREMSERLLEAQDRGLWKPKSNTAARELSRLAHAKEAAQ
jgi:cobalamin biosynthesis Mg chelatase CobN